MAMLMPGLVAPTVGASVEPWQAVSKAVKSEIIARFRPLPDRETPREIIAW